MSNAEYMAMLQQIAADRARAEARVAALEGLLRECRWMVEARATLGAVTAQVLLRNIDAALAATRDGEETTGE